MHALVRRNSVLPPVVRLDVAWRTVAIVVALAAGVAGLVIVRQEDTSSVQATAATVWMSGETRGRVVLAAARGERPSVAIELGGEATAYDLADLGASVLVHDRTSGTVTELDARDGRERTTLSGPQPADERPALVGAGAVAYLVDVAGSTVQRIAADGTVGDAVEVPGVIDEWVGTLDGLLWLVDGAEGAYLRFDGDDVSVNRFADPGSELHLTAAGREPVVYDASTGRVRWLRQSTSTGVPGRVEGAPVVVQEPDPAADCVSVLAGTTLSCIGDVGVVRQIELAAPIDAAATQLFSGETHAVVAGPGTPVVHAIAWGDGAVVTHARPEPSARALVGSSATGPLVIDDPASRYSFSVDRGELVELDKFSRRTVVISSDGSSPDGVGTFDEDADVEGVIAGGDSEAADLDDDGVNDPPVPRDDTAVTRIGRAVSIGVLANDVDPDGDPLTIVEVEAIAPAEGTVTVLEGSRINFEPSPTSGEGIVSFDYTVADPGGLSATATVSVEVIGADRNTDPRLTDDEAATQVNTGIDIAVLVNDADDEGDPLSIVAVSTPEHGTTAIESGGAVRYEPDPGYTGGDTFTYTVDDGHGGDATATVTVEITPPAAVNEPPDAVDDRASGSGGVRQRIEVLGNDTDPDGDRLRIVAVSSLPGVEIVVVDEQSIDVTPAAGTAGTLTFTYTIADPEGLQDTAEVALIVAAPEPTEPPVAIADTAVSASVAVPIDVVANDVDPSGGQLVVSSWTQPPANEGSVARVSPTTVRFTPVVGFLGTSRFSYTVQNVAGLTASATVSVTVTRPTGSGPVARADQVTVFPGEVAVVRPLANDVHPDGLPFDYSGPPTVRAGVATVNADRSISFTPPNGDLAVHVLRYSIQDAFGRRSSADITISVVARPVLNQPPTANPDVVATTFDTPVTATVLGNDTDPDGDDLRIVDVGTPSAGTAALSGTRIRYTPPSTFAGVATVQYTIADEAGLTSSATLTVQVAERVRVAPLTSPDLIRLVTGTTGTVNPITNDSDADGAAGSIRLTSIGTPSPASAFTASMVAGGVRVVAGTTPGSYSLSYTITDSDGLTASGTITVVVTAPPNEPPVAVGDTASGLALPITIAVLENDLDPDGGTLTLQLITAVSPSGAGTVAIVGNSVRYTPPTTFSGTASFSYTVRDNLGATASASVTMTITACGAPPALTPVSTTTRFGTPLIVSLFPSGAPPAGSTITLVQPAAGTGTATLAASQASVTYTPPAAFNGTAEFSYRATTNCGTVVNAPIVIDVNRVPNAVNDTAATPRNRPVVVPVLANDTDPDLDTLAVASVAAGTNGTPSLLAGVVTFTPNPGFTGTATFSYTVRDIGGLTDTATVTVTVANQAPVAADDVGSLPTLAALTSFTVLANDDDANDDTLTITAITAPVPAGVVVAVNGGTSILVSTLTTSVPATVTLTYTVSDGLLTDTARLTINVTNRPPIAAPNTGTIDLFTDASVTVNVLANDTDPDDPPPAALTITAQSVANPAQGSVTRTGGSLVFTPAATLTAPGTVTINYTIADAFGGTAVGVLTITVTDSSPPPTTTTTTPPTTTTTTPPTTTTTTVPTPPPEP